MPCCRADLEHILRQKKSIKKDFAVSSLRQSVVIVFSGHVEVSVFDGEPAAHCRVCQCFRCPLPGSLPQPFPFI